MDAVSQANVPISISLASIGLDTPKEGQEKTSQALVHPLSINRLFEPSRVYLHVSWVSPSPLSPSSPSHYGVENVR